MTPGAQESNEGPKWTTAAKAVELIASWIHRSSGTTVQYEDLVSAGNEALFLAERQFEDARGVPFGAYARIRIRRSMIDAVRREGRLSGRSLTKLRCITISDDVLDELTGDDQFGGNHQAWAIGATTASTMCSLHGLEAARTPEDMLGRAELKHKVAVALKKRSPQVQRLFRLVYEDALTLDEAAKKCGVSPSWATRIHAREMVALGRELAPMLEPRSPD